MGGPAIFSFFYAEQQTDRSFLRLLDLVTKLTSHTEFFLYDKQFSSQQQASKYDHSRALSNNEEFHYKIISALRDTTHLNHILDSYFGALCKTILKSDKLLSRLCSLLHRHNQEI